MGNHEYTTKDESHFHSTEICKLSYYLLKFHIGLKRLFYSLGNAVATHKGYFILIPLFLTILSITGFQKIHYEDDPEYLFAPSTGPARGDRSIIEENFSMNFTSVFDPTRITRTGRFARLIIVATDGGTLLRQSIWKDIMKLDTMVKNIAVNYDDRLYVYEDLCAIRDGKCYRNEVLGINRIIDQVENGSFLIQYPMNLEPFLLPHFFGGLGLDDKEEVVLSASAITLYYWIRTNNDEEIVRGKLWEKKLLRTFNENELSFETIEVARFTSTTLEDELENNTNSVKPFVAVTLTIMTLFSVIVSIMGDWVRGKPLLGIVGVMTSVFSSFAAFGFLIYIDVPFIGINMAAPFLMLGIGIDDTFVMLAAWRRTCIQDPVPKRLAEAYSEAAVSITITSLTDMISFFIGVLTPFPSVQIFCLYTGTAVFVTYIWHITLFGGCLAVAGYAERNQRHSLWCIKVKPKSQSENFLYRTFCGGGISNKDPWNPKDNHDHIVMAFFRDYVGTFLNIPAIKAFVVSIFVLYLCGAFYGCLRVKEGLEKRRLSRYDSYSVDFYDLEDKYFRVFPYSIQVVVTGNLTYSDPKTKSDYLALMKSFENQSYIHPKYTQSVIRFWYSFLEENEEWLEFNITDEKSFIRYLREVYVSDPSDVLNLDIKYNKDFTRILATRFILQTYELPNSNADKDMMEGLRAIARDSKFNVTVFNPYFVFFDQLVLVRSLSIQAISLAALVMMFVSFIFIPNFWCSLWVAFSIISIEVGVVGYMTMWNVSLDSISMINLIMCIGFSVDFSAHISYAYLTSNGMTSEERVKDCLFTLGLPIVQGGISTILGVIALTMAPSYIFVTFFKIVFLVIFFGIMHGIFLLPVLLSFIQPNLKINNSKDEKISSKNVFIDNINKKLNLASEKVPPLKEYKLPEMKETNSRDKVHFQSGAFLAPILMKAEKCNEILEKDMGIGTSGEDSSESSSQVIEERNNYNDSSLKEISNPNEKKRVTNFPIKAVYNNKAFESDLDSQKPYYENCKYESLNVPRVKCIASAPKTRNQELSHQSNHQSFQHNNHNGVHCSKPPKKTKRHHHHHK